MQILVVDDETDVRDLFQQRFRREIRNGELQFNFAFSGEEALDFLRAHHSEVLIVLSDINMPGMSGLELLGYVKEEFEMPPTTMMMKSPSTMHLFPTGGFNKCRFSSIQA